VENLRKLKHSSLIYLPLIAILLGIFLVSTIMGPYQTLDTQLELNTTKGILRWGYPYLDRYGEPYNNSYGDLFNMPPLGFYTQAAYFTIVPASEQNGIALMTAFGLGCVVLVYLIGSLLYDRKVGLLAATLFGLAPWQLILSRAFLIDAQSLLLSLSCFYFGILAIRKESNRLTMVSGVFFALALLTKQFAVFVLIPLLLLYLRYKPNNNRKIISQAALFSLPAVLSNLIWYQLIMGKELTYLFSHNDIKDLNFPNVTPTYSFLSDFFTNYGLGVFLISATLFACLSTLFLWKHLSKQAIFSDILCVVTICVISSIVLFFGVTMNLKAPYTSAVKYAYQTLPFFCLLVASLALKGKIAIKLGATEVRKRKQALFYIISSLGISLIIVSILADFGRARQLSITHYFVFRVQPDLDVGYSFFVNQPLAQSSPMLLIQTLGFLLIVFGLILENRCTIFNILKKQGYVRK
jgi:4-amino-4-deoxy-L-arabinose transferase-like glycosyltransferase